MPASPEYVLSVLQESARQLGLGDAIHLDRNSTAEDWVNAADLCDFSANWKSGEVLNQLFGLSVPPREWRALWNDMEPARTLFLQWSKPRPLSLWELCTFVAERTTQPTLEPATVLGQPCLRAGVFLALKREMVRFGAKDREIGPSASLTPFIGCWQLSAALCRIVPGSVPTTTIGRSKRQEHPVWGRIIRIASQCTKSLFVTAGLSLLVAFVLWLVGADQWPTVARAVTLFMLAVGSAFVTSRLIGNLPRYLGSPEIRTFRDLATHIANSIEQAHPSCLSSTRYCTASAT